MKYLVVACILLFPPESSTREPRQAPARWSGKADDRVPLPRLGICPGGFEAWSYDGKRGEICVRRA